MKSITSYTSDFFVIRGGIPLRGSVKISGAKNSALPVLISTLLTSEKCLIHNVPDLLDIKHTLELLSYLGVNFQRQEGSVFIEASKVRGFEAPDELVRKMRASILVMGPLLARFGKAVVAMPGGCSIGVRAIDQHLKVFEKGGAHVQIRHGYVHLEAKSIKPVDFTFDVITVTGTENALMFLSMCEKRSVLRNIALEPEVMDLVEVLRKMGVEIEIHDRTAIIRGNRELLGFEHRIIPDRIEAGTFMIASLMTGGDVLLEGVNPSHLGSLIEKLKDAGANVEIVGVDKIRVSGGKGIRSVDVSTSEYPGFPTDMQAQFMACMCLGDGVSEITENIFENRFQHVGELQRMGANIRVKGRTAIVKGVDTLYGAEVFSTDLRASASLVLAGLVAKGTTIVRDIYHLDRGYERIEEKLRALGAQIERRCLQDQSDSYRVIPFV